MGREMRRVPPHWQHPQDAEGDYRPLYGSGWEHAYAVWKQGQQWWHAGFRWKYGTGFVFKEPDVEESYEEWEGAAPCQAEYMPTWAPRDAYWYQMYETTTEGTPISPPLPSPEQLAQWLVAHQVSAFAGETASYDAWLAVCQGGYAPSAVSVQSSEGISRLVSGVEAVYAINRPQPVVPFEDLP